MVTNICIGAILTKMTILTAGTSHAWLQNICMKAILTQMAMLTRETNHAWLQIFAWGDLNENGIFRYGKLIIHGCRILYWGILTEMNILKREISQITHLIFWDRKINVISLFTGCWVEMCAQIFLKSFEAQTKCLEK